MNCTVYDSEVMVLNPGWAELEVCSASIQNVLELKILIASASVYLRARASEITSHLSDNVAVHFCLCILMAKWFKRWHLRDMNCTVPGLKVMVSNPGQVEFEMCSTSA